MIFLFLLMFCSSSEVVQRSFDPILQNRTNNNVEDIFSHLESGNTDKVISILKLGFDPLSRLNNERFITKVISKSKDISDKIMPYIFKYLDKHKIVFEVDDWINDPFIVAIARGKMDLAYNLLEYSPTVCLVDENEESYLSVISTFGCSKDIAEYFAKIHDNEELEELARSEGVNKKFINNLLISRITILLDKMNEIAISLPSKADDKKKTDTINSYRKLNNGGKDVDDIYTFFEILKICPYSIFSSKGDRPLLFFAMLFENEDKIIKLINHIKQTTTCSCYNNDSHIDKVITLINSLSLQIKAASLDTYDSVSRILSDDEYAYISYTDTDTEIASNLYKQESHKMLADINARSMDLINHETQDDSNVSEQVYAEVSRQLTANNPKLVKRRSLPKTPENKQPVSSISKGKKRSRANSKPVQVLKSFWRKIK